MSGIFHPDENHIKFGGQNACSGGKTCIHCARNNTPVEKSPTDDHPIRSASLLIHQQHNHSSNSGICNMSKHRVIEARPHLLPVASYYPLPRSKTWHKSLNSKPPLPGRSHLSDSPLPTSSYNGDASDSDVSVFTNDNDTSSILSDTVSSVLNEDFSQALTLSFKPPSDNESLDPNILMSDHIFASVPNQENTFTNSDTTSLVDDTSILEHTELKLMSLPSSYSHNPDTASVDQSSDVTTFSCSSMSMDQDGLLLSDQFSARNSSKCASPGLLDEEKQTLETEIRHLKQSLKLSEADTAILVSSKQQLQLDLHDATENGKNLRNQLQKALVSSAQYEKNSIVLKANLEKEREKYRTELQLTSKSIEQLKSKLDKVTTDFDDVRLEKDNFKLQCKNLDREKQTLENHNKSLQKEIDQLTSSNNKLTSVINKSNEDNAGNQEYIDIIRAERDNYVKRLHEMEQADLQQKLAARRSEERITQLNEVNLKLSMEKDNLHKTSQEQSDLISSLQAQLALKLNEKEALDGAVSRLHDDLHKVEAGFTKIKKEIALKSGVAEREHSSNSQLKTKVGKLEEQIQQLTLQAKVHTQRISDKNNQIVQLTSQLKAANKNKSSEVVEMTKLKSSLGNMEKRWAEVVEREKSLVNDLKLKMVGLSASEKKCRDLETQLELEKSKHSKFKVEKKTLSATLSAKDTEIKSLKKDLFDEECKNQVQKQTLQDNLDKERQKFEEQSQALQSKVEALQQQLLAQETAQHHNQSDTHEHMELLAELQKSRRELVSQISTMQRDKDLLVSEHQREIEKLSLSANEQHLSHEKFNAEHEEKEKLLLQDINNTKQQLADQTKVADDLKLALSHLTDKFAAAKEAQDGSEDLLKSKAKEIVNLQAKNRNLQEELVMVKQEMNRNALKLMEDLRQKNASQVEQDKIDNLLQSTIDERDKLREAVDQQQRYMVALQAHYQQWATQAAAQLKLTQKSKQHTFQLQDSSSQTEHDNDPVNVVPAVVTMESSSQTDHDNDPVNVHPASSTMETSSQTDHVNVIPIVVTIETSSQTDHDNDPVVVVPTAVTMESCSQTDHVNVVRAAVMMETYSQNDHDNDPVVVVPTAVTMETSSQTNHDNDPVVVLPTAVTMETCSQTDHVNVVPAVVTMETCSQTDHDNDPMNVFPVAVTMETCSQTDHENDPVNVVPTVVTMETSSQTDQENDPVNVVPAVVTMETSSQTDQENDPVNVVPTVVTMETSSQTDHENDPVNVVPTVVTMETSSQTDQENDPVNVVPAVVTMEISSQTDHDNDPVYLTPAAVSMETSTQTDHEHDSMNIVPTVFSSYPTEAVDGSTQTYLDSDRHTVMPSFSLLNSLPLDNTVPKAFNEKGCKQICNTPQTKSSMSDENTLAAVEMVDSFTQTNHDEKPIASSPVCSPYKQRQISIDHGEKVCEHVLPSQSGQCDLHSSYILEQSMDNDSSYMSHESLDRLPLNHHPRQCMQCGNSIRNVADANTQTHHDLQPVYSRSNYNLQLVNTETQTEVSRIKSLDLTDVKSLVRTDIHLNSYFPSANDVSVQTCNEQVENEVILCNMSCQTEHDCKVPKTQTNYLTFESSTQTEHNNTVVGKPWLEPRFLSDVKANSISSQTVLSDNTSSDQCYRDNICKHCGRLPSQKTSIFVQTEQTDLLSSLPNPTEVARILSSGDAAKLKAYKNTVNVLKRKLKAAQETISEQGTSICSLQDELAALKSLLESKTASEKAVNIKEEGLGLDRLQEELRHWKGVAENKEFEISSLKSEIEKLKHGYETETEKQARKSFAQRKLQEKKIKDANERVVALVDANGKLRRSVEKLQIKLTTCSQQLEIGQREKLRYQNRARKLQANLRSLSWLSNSEDKATEKCQTKSLPEETKLKKRNSLEIPSSVKDIENVLSNLKCEISSLERQLSDHNAVVNQSKASWKEIRRPLLSENKSDSVETMQAVDDGFGEIV